MNMGVSEVLRTPAVCKKYICRLEKNKIGPWARNLLAHCKKLQFLDLTRNIPTYRVIYVAADLGKQNNDQQQTSIKIPICIRCHVIRTNKTKKNINRNIMQSARCGPSKIKTDSFNCPNWITSSYQLPSFWPSLLLTYVNRNLKVAFLFCCW